CRSSYSFPTRRSSDLGAVCARVDDGVIVVGVFQVLKPTTKNYLAIRGRHGLVMSRVDVRVRTETQVNYFVVTDRCHYSSPSVSRSEEHTSELQSRENL